MCAKPCRARLVTKVELIHSRLNNVFSWKNTFLCPARNQSCHFFVFSLKNADHNRLNLNFLVTKISDGYFDHFVAHKMVKIAI